MKHLIRKLLTLFWLVPLAVAAATPGGWFDPSQISTPLREAHEAYLNGDMRSMALDLKEVLQSGDSLSQSNALALVEEAYKSSKGQLPTDWSFPKEVSDVRFALKHYGRPDGDNYALTLSGTVPMKGLLKQLQIMRYPDQTVLDLDSNRGGTFEESNEGDVVHFELEGSRTSQPPPEGLYLINLTLTNGDSAHGWFILSNLTSSQTPTIDIPHVGQTFNMPTPSLSWSDFFSPEYNGKDRRSLYVQVAKSDPPAYDWLDLWEMNENDPSRTEVTVGKEGHGVNHLEDGRYVLSVNYGESRKFGDLTLSRRSVTLTPFFIHTK
jgi:hypothetical protein